MTTRQQLIPKLLWRYCSKNHYARCCTRIFSSSGGDNSSNKIDLPAVEYASEFKGPIVNQLWTARQEEKRKATAQLEEINFEDVRVPADSVTKIKYNFSSDKFLRERYRNPFGLMRFGKVLEDLDALAGNIAFKHVRDPTIEIVTASVDRILLNGLPDLIYDQSLSGKVTYVGTSSMEIRMQCKCSGIEDSDAWIEAYFTFVAVDPDTKKPTIIPQLEPQTWLEKDQFEAGKRRAQLRKEERKNQKNLDPEIEKEARQLLSDGAPLINIPSLANPYSILMEHTKLQNCEITQPQTANLANQIFGGFLMRRAFDLAFATAYVFAGARPRFVGVDAVAFTIPVNVGDLTNFQAQIIYSDIHDDARGFSLYKGMCNGLISVEVYAWIVQPEHSSAKLSNKFVYNFAVDVDSNKLRKVLPSNMEEARKMAIACENHK